MNKLFLYRLIFLLFIYGMTLSAQAKFTDQGDGTVIDTITGLMWDKCSWGQTRTGSYCTGSATIYTWRNSLNVAVTANQRNWRGYSDWRLPNQAELESLIDITKATGPTINITAFPSTPARNFWSSTIYAPYPTYAWYVDFYGGLPNAYNQINDGHVRLVRGGGPLGAFDSQQYLISAGITSTNKYYDGTISAKLAACTLSHVVPGDTVTCSASTANFSDANAGSNKTVTATGITLAGADAGKYTLMNTTATTTADILKAPATVTLANLSQTYTGSPLTPSATTSPANLALTWTGAPQTNAGSYPVTAKINEQNYQGSASGSFVIERAPATVSLSNLTQTYTGLPLSPTATTNPPGLSVSLSGAPQTNAGSYPVTASITNPNYSGATSGSFVIAKAPQAPVFINAPAWVRYQQPGLSVFGTGGSGTGAFTYSAAGSTACTVHPTSGALTITSGSGSC